MGQGNRFFSTWRRGLPWGLGLLVFIVAACGPVEQGWNVVPTPTLPTESGVTPTPSPTPTPSATTGPTATPTQPPVLTPVATPSGPAPTPQALAATPVASGGEPHPISNWFRGMTLSPQWEEYYAYTPFKDAVDEIAALNANYITLVVPYGQEDITSTELFPVHLTPADDVLAAGIEYVHSQCLGVMLKPHVDVTSGGWQANLAPTDRDEWFRNYSEIILHYAELAEAHGVEILVIGAELNSMSSAAWDATNTGYWRELIRDVRDVYSGQITYSGQWGPTRWSVENIEFLDELDFVGISAFFDLSTESISVRALEDAWARWDRDQIRPVYEKYGKPIVFTEVGYRSQTGARFEPWATLDTEYNEEEQANLYEALMSYWSNSGYFGGMFWWEWRDDLPPENTYYTPNGKLAEDVLARWFGAAEDVSADGCIPTVRERSLNTDRLASVYYEGMTSNEG